MITHTISAVLILAVCIVGMFTPVDIDTQGGALVVDFGTPIFQLNGMIFGGYSAHEYGHYMQQRDIGDAAYYASVVVPSVLTNIVWGVAAVGFDTWLFRPDEYTDLFPWEADADRRSGL